MKQFGTILQFELMGYLKNKIFTGVTIFLVIVIAAVMSIPRFTGLFAGGGEPEERPVLLLSAPEGADGAALVEAFEGAFPDYEVRQAPAGDLEVEVTLGTAECAFALTSLTEYTYYVNGLSLYDANTQAADQLLQELYRRAAMVESGLAPEAAERILSTQVGHETVNLGKDQRENFFYTYIMIFALYMVILLYGQMVATNVATEKSSRAMEVLITSARPTAMMFGKVLASCLAGLLQLVCVFGSAFLFYNLNRDVWDAGGVVSSIFGMPLSLLLYLLLFFVLGFLIYAFLYGAVGSTASKLEDINTSVMPITMLYLIAFFVVIFSMSSGSVDNVLMKVCSFIPFTSPMAMFTRIAMSSVPWYEVALSVAILAASVVGVGVIAARIYRVGVLLYGTTPRLSAILKAVREA